MSKIVIKKNIPYAGGTNRSGKKVYISKDIPRVMKIGKKTINPRLSVAVHEKHEVKLMNKGMKYQKAHKLADKAENKYVKSKGISPKHYNQKLAPYIKKAEHEKGKIPKDLNKKPYRDTKKKHG